MLHHGLLLLDQVLWIGSFKLLLTFEMGRDLRVRAYQNLCQMTSFIHSYLVLRRKLPMHLRQTCTLDKTRVQGKIVACLRGGNARVEKGVQALLAGAAGMILCNDKDSDNEIIADLHVLPATQLT